MNFKNKVSGFTLIELIIVIAIIGILFAFVAPNFGGNIGKAKDSVREATARSAFQILETELLLNGNIPNANDALSKNNLKKPEGSDLCLRWALIENPTGLDEVAVAVLLSDGKWKGLNSGASPLNLGQVTDTTGCPSLNASGKDFEQLLP